jgi:hypothetical protein
MLPADVVNGSKYCDGSALKPQSDLDPAYLSHTNVPLAPGMSIDTACASPTACSKQGGCWIMHKPICKQFPNTCTSPSKCKSTSNMSWGNGYGCIVKTGGEARLTCSKSSTECASYCKINNIPPENCKYGPATHQTVDPVTAIDKLLSDALKLPAMMFCDLLGGCGNLRIILIVIAVVIVVFMLFKFFPSSFSKRARPSSNPPVVVIPSPPPPPPMAGVV